VVQRLFLCRSHDSAHASIRVDSAGSFDPLAVRVSKHTSETVAHWKSGRPTSIAQGTHVDLPKRNPYTPVTASDKGSHLAKPNHAPPSQTDVAAATSATTLATTLQTSSVAKDPTTNFTSSHNTLSKTSFFVALTTLTTKHEYAHQGAQQPSYLCGVMERPR
jgi:hypothetical protein